VLVPRYKDSSLSYTKAYNAPPMYPAIKDKDDKLHHYKPKIVLELRRKILAAREK